MKIFLLWNKAPIPLKLPCPTSSYFCYPVTTLKMVCPFSLNQLKNMSFHEWQFLLIKFCIHWKNVYFVTSRICWPMFFCVVVIEEWNEGGRRQVCFHGSSSTHFLNLIIFTWLCLLYSTQKKAIAFLLLRIMMIVYLLPFFCDTRLPTFLLTYCQQ